MVGKITIATFILTTVAIGIILSKFQLYFLIIQFKLEVTVVRLLCNNLCKALFL
jgi:hypothetical protein